MRTIFPITQPREAVEELFGVVEVDPFPPRYNIAPTQPILVVARDRPAGPATISPGAGRSRTLGLVALWVKDPRSSRC